MNSRLFSLLLALGCVVGPAVAAWSQDRETKVRNDKKNLEADSYWIYNDLPRGLAEAQRTGKPLLVVFRCIPCEACAEFDEQVVRREPAIRDLMDQFVGVRIVQANGMDLGQFQFDFDQSLAAFFMNADRVIYGRFGSRSANQEIQDMSIEGFGKALALALEWHQQYPANQALFAKKRGPQPGIKRPEEYPSLAGKFSSKLDYEGKVVQSCMHCHQVREAMRQAERSQSKPISDELLFPWPIPDVIGLAMDSSTAATVKSVVPGSAAQKAGFQPGDTLRELAGQPLLSIADIQWVLHNARAADELPVQVQRGDMMLRLRLALENGWRRKQDISWRATTWDLRRMATGGMRLEDLPAPERQSRGLEPQKLALRVKHVGQYGEHAVAKQLGFQKEDVIVSVDGRRDRLTESDFLALAMQQKKPGDKLAVSVLRGNQELSFQLPLR